MEATALSPLETRRWKHPLSLIVVLLAAGGCSNPYEAVLAGDLDGLTARLSELRQDYAIPGMAAGIAIDGKIVWTHGFGRADVEAAEPVTDSTVFLASLTKTLASVVLLQLVEEATLGLDDSVSMHGVALPSAESIRVRHLLSHTSSGEPGSVFGWFSTLHSGERVVWHYGYWVGNSSLIVRLPERDVSFVLLANSDGISREFRLGAGELESSYFARAFLQ